MLFQNVCKNLKRVYTIILAWKLVKQLVSKKNYHIKAKHHLCSKLCSKLCSTQIVVSPMLTNPETFIYWWIPEKEIFNRISQNSRNPEEFLFKNSSNAWMYHHSQTTNVRIYCINNESLRYQIIWFVNHNSSQILSIRFDRNIDVMMAQCFKGSAAEHLLCLFVAMMMHSRSAWRLCTMQSGQIVKSEYKLCPLCHNRHFKKT